MPNQKLMSTGFNKGFQDQSTIGKRKSTLSYRGHSCSPCSPNQKAGGACSLLPPSPASLQIDNVCRKGLKSFLSCNKIKVELNQKSRKSLLIYKDKAKIKIQKISRGGKNTESGSPGAACAIPRRGPRLRACISCNPITLTCIICKEVKWFLLLPDCVA